VPSQVVQRVQTEENDQVRHQPDKPSLQLIDESVTETTETSAAVTTSAVTTVSVRSNRAGYTKFAAAAYYWCRVCRQKTPAAQTRGCDCGVIMCKSCWGEWDFQCPLCESDMS